MKALIKNTIDIINNIDLKNNVRSGLTVGLVNIPLSIALAVAAGIPPTLGIITSVWAGLFMVFGGGSKFSIVGSVAAITGILTYFVSSQGYQQLPLLSLVTTGFIFVALVFKMHRFVNYIPQSVIIGFMVGVALIIFKSQLHIGYDLSEVPLYIVLVLFLFFFPWKKIPVALILFPAGIILSSLELVNLITLSDIYPDLSFSLIESFSLEASALNYELIKTAFMLSMITMTDCLLSARIAKEKTNIGHSDYRELFGLFLANGASGIAGGMPATASLSRTALNIYSGATYYSSAVINALAMAAVCLLAFNTFSYVPMVVIGAILTHVAFKLVSPVEIKKLYDEEPVYLLIALLVTSLTIYYDPLIAIVSGFLVSKLYTNIYKSKNS